MGGGKMVLCVKRVKQELPEERDDTMPLPGDIIEGLACEEDDDLAGESFIPAQGRSEFTSQLGKIASQWKSEVIWVKMRRGENVVKIKARVVPEKGGMLQRKFTIQAATDDRHVAILRDLNLKECTELQGKSFQSTLKDFTISEQESGECGWRGIPQERHEVQLENEVGYLLARSTISDHQLDPIILLYLIIIES
ncbi:uncharacterized protein LOC116197019 [Punica granatum]|uniref:Uncharacterized protein LOC116197019 n=1 Tax=Punica granatum TaxID=22663 RepID=A0A6P8CKE7_PUNGR|nr:uncharacterized protein LOC116197019 [Punica granatum]